MKPLFVVATGTNIGKTFVSTQLIKKFGKYINVGAFKPIETGVTTIALDASSLLAECKLVNQHFTLLDPSDITAYSFSLPAAPFCSDKQNSIKIDTILTQYKRLKSLCDILIIEGAGGLLTPITKDFKMIDLIPLLNASVLLVTPSKLGCINDTLLSMEALKSRDIAFDWCVNLYEEVESFGEVTRPYYDATFPNWWSVQNGLDEFVVKYIKSNE